MAAGMGSAAIWVAASDEDAASGDTAASMVARLDDTFPMENAEDDSSKLFALKRRSVHGWSGEVFLNALVSLEGAAPCIRDENCMGSWNS